MMHYKNMRTKSFRLAKSNTEGNYRSLSLSNMRHRGVPIKHTTERRKNKNIKTISLEDRTPETL
jgi:hypothetical protein